MPMIRCPYCVLRQYAPATHAALAECARCGHRFEVRRAAQIAPMLGAARAIRGGFRKRSAGDRP